MRPYQVRLLARAAEATPRQWLIGSVIAVALIGSVAVGFAIMAGAQNWHRYARTSAEYVCERSLREARGAGAYRTDPVCQCTAERVAAQRPSLSGYLSQHAARREARDMADLALPDCLQEAAS